MTASPAAPVPVLSAVAVSRKAPSDGPLQAYRRHHRRHRHIW